MDNNQATEVISVMIEQSMSLGYFKKVNDFFTAWNALKTIKSAMNQLTQLEQSDNKTVENKTVESHNI